MSPPIIGPGVAEVSCDVVAWGAHRASAAELPGLRKSPGPLGEEMPPIGLLRHVDEQTVVGVAAVLDAIRESGLDPSGFGRWSVLVAPRFLGRARFEKSFPQYRAEGAWGVSPHLVPGHSLHSPSGAISQLLQSHGPNLGIGGTPGGEREALLVAATWLEAGWAEGVWVVTTAREPRESGEVALSEPGDYRALALALVASKAGHAGTRLRIGPRAVAFEMSESDEPARAGFLDWFEPSGIAFVARNSRRRADPGHDSDPPRPPHFPAAPSRADRAPTLRGTT